MEDLERAGTPESAKPPRVRFSVVLIVLFLGGVAYGAVLAGNAGPQLLKILDSITRGFLLARAGDGFGGIFLRSMTAGMLLVGAVFLCGFSAVGQPFSLFLLLFRGIGFGMTMGYFYALPEGGVLTAAAILLPSGALSGYTLILACRESVRLSGKFFRTMTAGEPMSAAAFRIYALKFLILSGMQLTAAFLDGACTRLFARFLS